MTQREPSPEVKAIIKQWVEHNRAKYGPDWKKILAKEMADKTSPYMEAFIRITGVGRK